MAISMLRWLLAAAVGCCGLAASTVAGAAEPTVLVSLLVRRHGHTLPYFLQLLQSLDYPKRRMRLWIHIDGRQDRSAHIIDTWLSQNLYQHEIHEDGAFQHEPNEWAPQQRVRHVASLKERALLRARQLSFDYVWFLDCDVFVTQRTALKSLVAGNGYAIVAPMMDSLTSRRNYRPLPGHTDGQSIDERTQRGCFEVAVVHNCFLINLKRVETGALSFLAATRDDAETEVLPFGAETHLHRSQKRHNVSSFLCNDEVYGLMVAPSTGEDSVDDEMRRLFKLIRQTHVAVPPMVAHPLLLAELPTALKRNVGLDAVFYINLDHRGTRRMLMENLALGQDLHLTRVPAVDGRTLTASDIESLGIRPHEAHYFCPLEDGTRPRRHLTLGEIGCFLSHYGIWKEMIDRNLEKVLILEDDVVFLVDDFRMKLAAALDELERLQLDWDLLYLQISKPNGLVDGSQKIQHVSLTGLASSYVLTQSGARKLIDADPLAKLIPVDDYISVLQDIREYCNVDMVDAWPPEQRNLQVYGLVRPLAKQRDHSNSDTGWQDPKQKRYIDGVIVAGEADVNAPPMAAPRRPEFLWIFVVLAVAAATTMAMSMAPLWVRHCGRRWISWPSRWSRRGPFRRAE